jgi:hypothetical protein
MSENTGESENNATQTKDTEQSADVYQGTVTRIEKSKRIKEDVKPSDGRPYNKERVEEIRDIEARSEQGDKSKESGLEELFVDARGYQVSRFKVNWKSPEGQNLEETLVMFLKQDKSGQPDFLKDNSGKILALNADLYESKITSHKHAQRYDSDTFTIPRIDGSGRYTGVVSLVQDKK